MSKPALRIEAISVGDLEAFAQRAMDEPGIVPITPRRARSHAANPHANDDEIALLVAYSGATCIGFMGIMAGEIFRNSEAQRMHWFSSWYVDPAHASTGAGAMLLMRAIGLKYDLAVTGTSPDADEMYEATRFTEIGPLQYEEVFLDAIDPLGFPFFALGKWRERRGKSANACYAIAHTLRPILQPAMKKLLYALTSRKLGRNPETELVPVEDYDAPAQSRTGVRFERDAATVNWMLRNPWFTEDTSEAIKGYYFGDHRPIFRYRAYSLERDRQRVGMAVLSVSKKDRQTTVKLLDHWYNDEPTAADLVHHVVALAATYSADRILLPHELRPHLKRIPMLGRLSITRSRKYFCRPKKKQSVLSPLLDEVELQLTDGDCAFS